MISYRATTAPTPSLDLKRAFSEIAFVAAYLRGMQIAGAQVPRRATMAEIQALVCGRFNLNPIEMQSERRSRYIARPRQIAMYLCRELTPRSLPQIGRAFGGRDHTTVIHACRQVERLCAADADFAATVRELAEVFPKGARA